MLIFNEDIYMLIFNEHYRIKKWPPEINRNSTDHFTLYFGDVKN